MDMAHSNNDELAKFRKMMRTLVADYMQSEGCGCCGDRDKHQEYEEKLGKALNVPKYKDGVGYNFHQYRTSEINKKKENAEKKS